MKRIIFHTFIISLLTLAAHAYELKLPSETLYKFNNEDSFKVHKSNEPLDIPADAPVFIKTKNNLPILIYQPTNKNSKIEINDSNFKELSELALNPILNEALNELTMANLELQTMIKEKNYLPALNRLSELKIKYPKIAHLYFLEASVLYLRNNKGQAIISLEKGVEIYPQNEDAQKLLKILKGGSR